jgi:hypothetical protein
MRAFCRRLAGAALATAIGWHPVSAQQDQHQHCPAAEAKNTHVFMSGGSSDREDKARLEALAGSVAKSGRPICVLAFVDPEQPNYSKMIAFRRATWARDTLIGKGVPKETIAMELRLLAADQDRGLLRQVSVLVGQ